MSSEVKKHCDTPMTELNSPTWKLTRPLSQVMLTRPCWTARNCCPIAFGVHCEGTSTSTGARSEFACAMNTPEPTQANKNADVSSSTMMEGITTSPHDSEP